MPSERINACWHCGKGEHTLDGQRMKACSRCAALGVKIYYCSRCVMDLVAIGCADILHCRECQVEDWKNGVPRPHKVLCGKQEPYLD